MIKFNSSVITFSWKDTLVSLIWLNKWRSIQKRWTIRDQNNQIYKEGVKLFHNELDWINLIRTIRKMNLFIDKFSDNYNQINEISYWTNAIKILDYSQNKDDSSENKKANELKIKPKRPLSHNKKTRNKFKL